MASPENTLGTRNVLLPYELLREIFHQATFIPHEWDVNATSYIPGLFCIRDNLQLHAWREMLPLRRAIAQVSSRWRAVALEFLYGTFHDNEEEQKLVAFDSILSDYPHYASLVKRLSIRLKKKPNHHTLAAKVLLHCPNLLIIDFEGVFGSGHQDPMALSNLTGLSATLRQLDIINVPTETVFMILNQLPNLEILSISGVNDAILASDCPSVVLSNLRIVQFISRPRSDVIELYMGNIKAPRLTTLVIDHFFPRLPDDVTRHLRDLEFIFPYRMYEGWRADDLPNLRRLKICWECMDWDTFLSHLPMKQIVELTCNSITIDAISRSRTHLESTILTTLNGDLIPNLKSFTLNMEYKIIMLLSGEDDTASELRAWFIDLNAAFDQRGVDLYFCPTDLLRGKVLMGDILRA